jgi:hypothetical protein
VIFILKRTLRSNTNNFNNTNTVNENNLNTEQKQQLNKLKGMAKKYEGKSDAEILKDLSSAVEKGKKDGSLTNEKIDSIASTIAPMLNKEQKAKLQKLMNTIKR